VHNSQAQEPFEMIEVTISMQQRMALQETKRRYQTVDRFADRVPMLAKAAEIPCGLDCQSSATRFKQFKVAKFLQDSRKCLLVADSLEGLTKKQIREAEALATDLTIEVVGFFVMGTAQVVDPDSGINNHHWSSPRKPSQTRSVKVSRPLDLASKPANASLRSGLDEQPQTRLYGRPLCARPTAFHRLSH
jgi:hypothetical protein